MRQWPRPNNIPGDGLKGILQPLLREQETSGPGVPGDSPEEEWEDFMYVNPSDAFAPEDDEEPWYWSVLDEEPTDYCPPGSPTGECDYEEQEEASMYLFQSRDGIGREWQPHIIDMPEDYVGAGYRKGWVDKQLGPTLGLQPTHHAGILGEEGPWLDTGAPPTPTGEEADGITPPLPGNDPHAYGAEQHQGSTEEGMTLTQAHE